MVKVDTNKRTKDVECVGTFGGSKIGSNLAMRDAYRPLINTLNSIGVRQWVSPIYYERSTDNLTSKSFKT